MFLLDGIVKFELRCFLKNEAIMKREYESPDIYVIDVLSEGVLCGSNEDLEETWGEWDFVKGANY